MSKFLFLSLALLGLSGVDLILAQTPAVPPAVHTVSFPMGDAAWNLALEKTQAEDGAPTPPVAAGAKTIKKIEVVRVGNLRRDKVLWTDGDTGEYWWLKDPAMTFFQPNRSGPVRSMKASFMHARRFDETAFSWVDAQTFAGRKPFRGVECDYYETKVAVFENETQTVQAWIDSKTRKPVAWKSNNNLVFFTFVDEVPVGPLTMPENFKKEVNRYQAYTSPSKKAVK